MSQLVFQVFFLYIFTEIILQAECKENPGIKKQKTAKCTPALQSLLSSIDVPEIIDVL